MTLSRKLARTPATPEPVIRWGWRDAPVRGDRACTGCGGWGTRSTFVGTSRTLMHRTCPDCRGKGRR